MARFVTCFAVSFILAFSLTGCGKKTTTTTTTASSSGSTKTSTSPTTGHTTTPTKKPTSKPTSKPTTKPTTKKTTKPTTTHTTTASTTQTTTNHIPKPPLSGDETAKYLNDIYYGNGKDNETAVYITFQDTWFFPCGTPCYKGKPDCFMSYAAYNNKMSLRTDKAKKKYFQPYANRQKGWIINSSRLESRYGKCAYIFDGTTDNRLYGGCGGPAPSSNKCKPLKDAYDNMCGPKKCTSNSTDVLRAYCKTDPNKPPKKQADPPCYWKLPAFDNESNELGEWYQARLEAQRESEDNLKEWNEIAVDLSVVKKDMLEDASKVIVAYVYHDQSGKEMITKQREEMQKEWQFRTGENIPLIKIDWDADVDLNEDVFIFEGGESVII